MRTTGKQRGGTTGRGFLPGWSGNPGGRPRGFGHYIRKQTRDGKELVDLVLTVFRGQTVNGRKPTIRDRVEAATWLSDRGFGRPTQPLEVEREGPGFLVLLRQPIRGVGPPAAPPGRPALPTPPAEPAGPGAAEASGPEEEILTLDPQPEEPQRRRWG